MIQVGLAVPYCQHKNLRFRCNARKGKVGRRENPHQKANYLYIQACSSICLPYTNTS